MSEEHIVWRPQKPKYHVLVNRAEALDKDGNSRTRDPFGGTAFISYSKRKAIRVAKQRWRDGWNHVRVVEVTPDAE